MNVPFYQKQQAKQTSMKKYDNTRTYEGLSCHSIKKRGKTNTNFPFIYFYVKKKNQYKKLKK